MTVRTDEERMRDPDSGTNYYHRDLLIGAAREIDQLRADLAAARAETEKCRATVVSLHIDLAESNAELVKQDTSIAELEKQLAECRADLIKARQVIAVLDGGYA